MSHARYRDIESNIKLERERKKKTPFALLGCRFRRGLTHKELVPVVVEAEGRGGLQNIPPRVFGLSPYFCFCDPTSWRLHAGAPRPNQSRPQTPFQWHTTTTTGFHACSLCLSCCFPAKIRNPKNNALGWL